MHTSIAGASGRAISSGQISHQSPGRSAHRITPVFCSSVTHLLIGIPSLRQPDTVAEATPTSPATALVPPS